jgi:hypothetical protein
MTRERLGMGENWACSGSKEEMRPGGVEDEGEEE